MHLRRKDKVSDQVIMSLEDGRRALQRQCVLPVDSYMAGRITADEADRHR